MTEREARRELIKAASEMGRALGIQQAARVVRKMADQSMRVVGTNELKELAASLEQLSDEIDAEARKSRDTVHAANTQQ